MATPKHARSKEESRTPKATPKSSSATIAEGKSSAKSAAETVAGKRGRVDSSTSKGCEGEHKRPKGKQIAAEEEEEHVTQLKKLSSINGLERSSLAHPCPLPQSPQLPSFVCSLCACICVCAACASAQGTGVEKSRVISIAVRLLRKLDCAQGRGRQHDKRHWRDLPALCGFPFSA